MDTNTSQTNPGGSNNSSNSGQYQNQNQNTGAYNNYGQPKPNYPRRRSTAAVIAGIVLILMGTSYVVNKFLPWVFDWLDSGLIIALVAIVAGFALMVRK